MGSALCWGVRSLDFARAFIRTYVRMEVACVLIPDSALADPLRAGEQTEGLLRRLERIGAAVESERPGEAFFALDGLRGIHGGRSAGVLAAARRAAETQVRIGVAPTRFAAHAAALRE